MASRRFRVLAMLEVFTDVQAPDEAHAIAQAMRRPCFQGCAPNPEGSWRHSTRTPVLRDVLLAGAGPKLKPACRPKKVHRRRPK